MAFKALINGRGNSQHIKDLFMNKDEYFEFVTTSDIWEDIINHFKFYQPDVYITMINDVTPNVISKLREIRKNIFVGITPIVIVADEECVEELTESVSELNMHIIKRPVSVPALKDRIYEYTVKRQSELEAEKAKKEAETNGKKNILVIDDDRSILKMLKSALEEKYNVTTMANGKMAYKFLETKHVDLILLDYEMPEESGPVVLSKLREDAKTASIPVVFLTGVSDSEKIREVLQMSPQGYLLKPIDIDRLKSVIKSIILTDKE